MNTDELNFGEWTVMFKYPGRKMDGQEKQKLQEYMNHVIEKPSIKKFFKDHIASENVDLLADLSYAWLGV